MTDERVFEFPGLCAHTSGGGRCSMLAVEGPNCTIHNQEESSDDE